jgi:streptogramin lyase
MTVTVGVSSAGLGYSNVYPPDTNGAVGPNHFLEAINLSVGYYSKSSGSLIAFHTLTSFFSALGGTLSFSDPVVAYDTYAGKFVVGALDYSSTVSRFDFAVSNTSDPTGTWTLHRYDMTHDSVPGTYLNDYPRMGYNADAYVISFNMFPLASGTNHVDTLSIDKNGLTGYIYSWPTGTVNIPGPAPALIHDGSAGGPEWLVGTGSGSNIKIFKMTNELSSSPTITSYSVAVQSYTSMPAPHDPGGAMSWTFDTRIFDAALRNNMLVAAHNIGSGGNAKAAWYEFSVAGPTPTLVQEGRVGAAGVDTYFPSIDINTANTLGMTYIQSSTTEYMSDYVTGWTTADPTGQMETGVEPAALTGTNHYSIPRCGDYSGTSVDPSNGTTFWSANEFKGDSTWNTGFASYTVSSWVDHFGVTTSVGSATAGAPFTVTVTAQDAANNTVTGYTGTVHFTGSDPQATLPPDYTFLAADNGVHTFGGVVFRSASGQTLTASSGIIGGVTEFAIPTGSSQSYAITAGPDGNLWFAEVHGNKIGRITPTGTVTEFAVPTGGGGPGGITAGPDGNVWFTELGGTKIGKITPAGAITEYAVPTANSQPYGITLGPDGNLWFVELIGNKVGRCTPTGSVTEFAIPTANSQPNVIAAGPDGNLWFTEDNGNQIGKVSLTGTVTEFSIPTANSEPVGITAGVDGNLWFTEVGGSMVARITPTGTVTEYAIPTGNPRPYGITAGPDGNVWFTEAAGNKVAQITPAGVVTEYAIPTATSEPYGITLGPDGNLWFVESYANQIGRITSGWPSGSATVTVVAAAADHYAVTTSAADPDIAGTVFDMTLTATDPYGNTDTNYEGTVTFSSADPYGPSLPADYAFQASDQGVATFSGVTALYTAGTWDVTATDTQSGITGAAFVNVQAAPAVGFQVVAPASATSGVAFDVTVIAVDPYGNTDMNYTGTIHFTTSDMDPGVVLPPDHTFQPSDAGMVTFVGGVTLITLGDQTLTATDTVSGITGTAAVTVTSGPDSGAGGFGGKPAVSEQSQSATVPTVPASPSPPSRNEESVPVRAQSVAATAHRAALIDHVWSDPADLLLDGLWTDGLAWNAGS